MTRISEQPLYGYARSRDQDSVSPARHPVIVVGAGPVGLAAAIDLAQRDIPVVLLDENDRVSHGSRAICFAKRTLEILDRLGCGQAVADRGVTWNTGKVFFGDQLLYGFDLLREAGHQRPAFVNLQQYHLEALLVARLRELQAQGRPVDLRGGNRVAAVGAHADHVRLEVDTVEGPYSLQADWLIACDGANSAIRRMMGLGFVGRVFEDSFLIADVVMQSDLPTERSFWFDPPFNPGKSALMHRQPDNVWRIDLQLGHDIDPEAESRPDAVIRRLRAMLGEDAQFDLDWVSVYTFQCCRMERFVHGRVIFAGDAAHQVSPFGARGANSGLQDADNLCWKLALVVQGAAPPTLLDSYNWERLWDADENILNSSRATEFITPKSDVSAMFRDAVLDLATAHPFARQMVNSGRLSVPGVYDEGPLNGPDCDRMPERTRPGSAVQDAPVSGGWLLSRLDGRFVVLGIDCDIPDRVDAGAVRAMPLRLSAGDSPELAARYLGDAACAVYLIRPDQHIAARWDHCDADALRDALRRASGQP